MKIRTVRFFTNVEEKNEKKDRIRSYFSQINLRFYLSSPDLGPLHVSSLRTGVVIRVKTQVPCFGVVRQSKDSLDE